MARPFFTILNGAGNAPAATAARMRVRLMPVFATTSGNLKICGDLLILETYFLQLVRDRIKLAVDLREVFLELRE